MGNCKSTTTASNSSVTTAAMSSPCNVSRFKCMDSDAASHVPHRKLLHYVRQFPRDNESHQFSQAECLADISDQEANLLCHTPTTTTTTTTTLPPDNENGNHPNTNNNNHSNGVEIWLPLSSPRKFKRAMLNIMLGPTSSSSSSSSQLRLARAADVLVVGADNDQAYNNSIGSHDDEFSPFALVADGKAVSMADNNPIIDHHVTRWSMVEEDSKVHDDDDDDDDDDDGKLSRGEAQCYGDRDSGDHPCYPSSTTITTYHHHHHHHQEEGGGGGGIIAGSNISIPFYVNSSAAAAALMPNNNKGRCLPCACAAAQRLSTLIPPKLEVGDRKSIILRAPSKNGTTLHNISNLQAHTTTSTQYYERSADVAHTLKLSGRSSSPSVQQDSYNSSSLYKYFVNHEVQKSMVIRKAGGAITYKKKLHKQICESSGDKQNTECNAADSVNTSEINWNKPRRYPGYYNVDPTFRFPRGGPPPTHHHVAHAQRISRAKLQHCRYYSGKRDHVVARQIMGGISSNSNCMEMHDHDVGQSSNCSEMLKAAAMDAFRVPEEEERMRMTSIRAREVL